MDPQLLTILCPVHNEERAIPLFFARILPVMETIHRMTSRHAAPAGTAAATSPASPIQDDLRRKRAATSAASAP